MPPIPPELKTATQASIQDAQMPKQGNAILRYMASCELRGEELAPEFLSDAANIIDDWIAMQVNLQAIAKEVLVLLNTLDVPGGSEAFPEWRLAPWSQDLMMPWSEGLKESLLSAFEYISRNA
jgi:hypothetical protein